MDGFAWMPHQARNFVREVRQIRRFAGTRASLRYLCAIAQHRSEIIRSGRLRAADDEMARGNYRMRVLGSTILVPGAYFGLARELYGRMCYFALEGFRVNAGDVVVDLGANCGLFSVLAAKMGARVLAVEAQSGFVKELQEIARLNDVVDRIAIEWALIGARAGDLSKAENLAKASHWEGNTPPQVSLESLLEKHRLSHVSFLKVDIEGSEFDLFGGEENALARIHRIAMEIHLDHGQADDVLEPLQRSGFKTALLSPELRLASQLSTPLGYVFAWRS